MKKDNIKVIKFIIFLCLLQGASYYICKFTPFDTMRLMSSFDDKIVRDPNYVFFYISWFPMLVIVPFLVSKTNKDNLFKYHQITHSKYVNGLKFNSFDKNPKKQ